MKSEKGFSLIEVMIAIGLLGIIGAGLIGAMGIASKALFTADSRETAKTLAESQMEFVKAQPYDTSEYAAAPIPAECGNYTAAIGIEPLYSPESNIQKITVTIIHQDKEVTELEDYKVR